MQLLMQKDYKHVCATQYAQCARTFARCIYVNVGDIFFTCYLSRVLLVTSYV